MGVETRSQPVAGPQIMVVCFLASASTSRVGQKLKKEHEGKKEGEQEGNKHKKGWLTGASQAAKDTKLLWV